MTLELVYGLFGVVAVLVMAAAAITCYISCRNISVVVAEKREFVYALVMCFFLGVVLASVLIFWGMFMIMID